MAADEEARTPPSGPPLWVTMDGIIEGRIQDFAVLTEAVQELNALDLCPFELDRDGGKFSLLPDNTRVSGRGFDEDRQSRLLEHLGKLAAGARGPVESTLRCTMVYADQCAETVFRAAAPPPAGPGVEPLTRVRPRRPGDVPPEVPPPPPWRGLLRRREVMLVLPLLVVAFAIFAWRSGLLDRVLSANAEGLQVDTAAFGTLLQAEVRGRWGDYEVTVRRGAGHPETPEAWDRLLENAATEAERLHAIVVREGQDLYVQLRDDADQVVAQGLVSLRPLVTAADGQARVTLPGRMTATRVVLSVTKQERR